MSKLFIVILTLLLTGCSTNPVPLDKAQEAPPARVMKYQSHNDGDATLTVIRDGGIVGSGCYTAVFVNGIKAAKLNSSEKVAFYLPAGEYAIGASFDGSGLCSMGKERQERTVTLNAEKAKTVRVYTDGSGNLDIKPSTL